MAADDNVDVVIYRIRTHNVVIYRLRLQILCECDPQNLAAQNEKSPRIMVAGVMLVWGLRESVHTKLRNLQDHDCTPCD